MASNGRQMAAIVLKSANVETCRVRVLDTRACDGIRNKGVVQVWSLSHAALDSFTQCHTIHALCGENV